MTKWEKMTKELNDFELEMVKKIGEEIKKHTEAECGWCWVEEHEVLPVCNGAKCGKYERTHEIRCVLLNRDTKEGQICHPAMNFMIGKLYDIIKARKE